MVCRQISKAALFSCAAAPKQLLHVELPNVTFGCKAKIDYVNLRRNQMRALALVALLTPGAANATFIGGNEIYDACRFNRDFVDGYASGVIDSLLVLKNNGQAPFNLCLPPRTEVRQASDVLCKHIQDNPSSRSYSASSIAFVAFQKVWTCPN